MPGSGFLNPMKWIRRIAFVVVLIYFAAAFADVVSASRHNTTGARHLFSNAGSIMLLTSITPRFPG
jgi:hypothetical protein